MFILVCYDKCAGEYIINIHIMTRFITMTGLLNWSSTVHCAHMPLLFTYFLTAVCREKWDIDDGEDSEVCILVNLIL